MSQQKNNPPKEQLTLTDIITGGQAIGTLANGKKMLSWGGLPHEIVEVAITKKRSTYSEGVVTTVISSSNQRITPRDPDSYLSTSPWQIMTFEAEQHYKAALIEEAFELHDIVLPLPIDVYTNGAQFEYRNKIEYSFWYDTDNEKLSLAFFRRGSHGKIAIQATSLAMPAITELSHAVLDVLNAHGIGGRELKTLVVRANQDGDVAWQLYVKNESIEAEAIIAAVHAQQQSVCGEVIFSNPKSPASVITRRLARSSDARLTDTILGVPFRYATEGFFQINLPVYEQSLKDMREWMPADTPVVDLYSGVGSIGLAIGGNDVTLVELNNAAVDEMMRNIIDLEREGEATAVLAPSEKALDYITGETLVIVDPPRAGLHEAVIERLLEVQPERIVYLSCNPVTQARDVMRLAETYGIRHHRGYNFFPRTPHIEHLVILDKK